MDKTTACRKPMAQLQLRLNLITEMAELKRFFGVFAKLRKANLSFFMSVRLPARMEQFRSHCTDFHDIPYLILFRKSVHKNIQVH
jgi:hypothetical protein